MCNRYSVFLAQDGKKYKFYTRTPLFCQVDSPYNHPTQASNSTRLPSWRQVRTQTWLLKFNLKPSSSPQINLFGTHGTRPENVFFSTQPPEAVFKRKPSYHIFQVSKLLERAGMGAQLRCPDLEPIKWSYTALCGPLHPVKQCSSTIHWSLTYFRTQLTTRTSSFIGNTPGTVNPVSMKCTSELENPTRSRVPKQQSIANKMVPTNA